MSLFKRSVTELLGTFWLVLGGCGSAVLAASSPLGIGVLGVALAFGLTVLTMAFAIGHISGCHLNPAVSVGLTVGGRFPARELPAYIIAQVIGAILAAALIVYIGSGKEGLPLILGPWESSAPPAAASVTSDGQPVVRPATPGGARSTLDSIPANPTALDPAIAMPALPPVGLSLPPQMK